MMDDFSMKDHMQMLFMEKVVPQQNISRTHPKKGYLGKGLVKTREFFHESHCQGMWGFFNVKLVHDMFK